MTSTYTPDPDRHKIKAMDSVRREDDLQQCQALNWTGYRQCAKMTHWVCNHCGRRVCGTHPTWHIGPFRTACSGSQVKVDDGPP